MTRAITGPQRLLSSALAVIAEASSTGQAMAGSPGNSYALQVRDAFDLIAWLVTATALVNWGFAGMRVTVRSTHLDDVLAVGRHPKTVLHSWQVCLLHAAPHALNAAARGTHYCSATTICAELA
jgi:hypothetical protein